MSLCVGVCVRVCLSPDTNRVIETVRSNWSAASLLDIIGIYDVLNVSFVPPSVGLIQQLGEAAGSRAHDGTPPP